MPGPSKMTGKMSKNLPCTNVVLEISEKLQEQVLNLNSVAKSFPESLVGFFIFIYWKLDEVWYRAKIVKYLDISKRFKVIYDDDTDEKLDLVHEWFLIEDEELKAQAAERKRERARSNSSLAAADRLRKNSD